MTSSPLIARRAATLAIAPRGIFVFWDDCGDRPAAGVGRGWHRRARRRNAAYGEVERGAFPFPDDVAAAAIAAQVGASGSCSKINTVQLLSVEDWVKACTMARDVASGYAAPSK